ncbi:hypothetical protein D3C71_1146510 [compost metagenome]
MAKYAPLIDLLQNTANERLTLSFRRIEEVIGDRLPESARAYAAWWANSSPNDSHSWSHAWQAAGWKATVKIANGTVEFNRFDVSPPSLVESLRPTSKRNVMDLVRAAGIDVRAWGYVDDRPYPVPQSNPNFCYDWSFGSPQEGYVLCVWHQDLAERKGRVVYDCDVGSHTRKLRQELGRTSLTDAQRGRLLKQVKRSEAFEAAVANSYYASRPLRLILNLGDMRSEDELADTSSTVSERGLDVEPWYVYTLFDGDALIVRSEPAAVVDPIAPPNDLPPESPGEDDKWRQGQIRVRQGQAEFRAKLLEAYERRCAVTGTRLEPLLEAAHIVPHSMGTDYRISNGLLLRADIHNLYDLHHLSIDERGAIHVSRTAMQTEYSRFHEKRMRFPAASLQPSPSSLASRHQRFIERERERL